LLEKIFSGEDDLVSGCEPFGAKESRVPTVWLGPRLVNLIHQKLNIFAQLGSNLTKVEHCTENGGGLRFSDAAYYSAGSAGKSSQLWLSMINI
jgi:hypothetical protein